MEKLKRKFRLNVCVTYPKNVNVIRYRYPILSTLKNFAWLYNLDYKIDVESQVFGKNESEHYSDPDLIYFRSTERTQIDLKKFQKVISEVFVYNPFLEGVEVGYQLQKALLEYPFPKDFCRTLNYPYLEIHSGDQIEIKVLVSDLKELIPDLYID